MKAGLWKAGRRAILSLCLGLGLLLLGCGESGEGAKSEKAAVDIDLTDLTETVAYAQAVQMTEQPQGFDGKSVRVQGVFNTFFDADTEEPFFVCAVPDSTGCCMASFEIVPDGAYAYPEDYPDEFSLVTVVGDFRTFDDGGYLGCRVENAIWEEAVIE